MKKKNTLAHLALLSVNLFYGANYLVAKGLMPEIIGPSGFILCRVAGATFLFMITWFLVRSNPGAPIRREKFSTKDWLRVVVCAVFGIAINQLFFFNGLNLTSPLHASIIMTLTPVLVVVFSILYFKTSFSFQKLLGIILGGIGAVWLILNTASPNDPEAGSAVGDLMILINASSYAVYLVLVKSLMKKYSALTVISRIFAVGLLFVLPFGWKQVMVVQWFALTTQQVLAMLFVVVVVSYLAYLFNLFALKYVGPAAVSAYIYLQPLVTFILALGWAALHQNATKFTEKLSGITLLCSLLIFAGVYLVSFTRTKAYN